jgi:hypothetical protein
MNEEKPPLFCRKQHPIGVVSLKGHPARRASPLTNNSVLLANQSLEQQIASSDGGRRQPSPKRPNRGGSEGEACLRTYIDNRNDSIDELLQRTHHSTANQRYVRRRSTTMVQPSHASHFVLIGGVLSCCGFLMLLVVLFSSFRVLL